MSERRPVVIGLTGGVASGKSTVAAEFARLGAAVLDADAVGHEALSDADVKSAVVAQFGVGVLGVNGAVDRQRLGAAVFGSPERVKALGEITHPWIRRTLRARLERVLQIGEAKAVVLDVSLLLESGVYEHDLDAVFFIDTPEGQRKQRAGEARGWSDDEVTRREQHQHSLERKRAAADAVIDNGHGRAALAARVEELWQEYVEPGGSAERRRRESSG